jgi:hypothetical protein
MPAVVVIDAHQDLTETEKSNINKIVEAAATSARELFYVLPEGASIHEEVVVADPHSKLYYNPDRDNAYRQARIDEQMTGRDIDKVQFYGPGTKPGNFSEKSKARGRKRFAGSPNKSNKPDWALQD